MDTRFSQIFENDGASSVLFVQGDLDVYSVGETIRQGSKLIKSNKSFDVIDLGQVQRFDSAGLAFVVELMKVAKQEKKKLDFINIPTRLRAVADVYGLSKILPDSIFQSS